MIDYTTHPTFLGFIAACGLYVLAAAVFGFWCLVKKLTS